jgi:formate dehydrogenase maturation protein FdhE
VKALHVGDVLDLASAQSADAEDRLEKLFEWDFERTMTTVRLLFAAAGSLLVALFAALFKEDAVIKTWHVAAIGGSSGVLALVLKAF